jgi:hypothetical protein
MSVGRAHRDAAVIELEGFGHREGYIYTTPANIGRQSLLNLDVETFGSCIRNSGHTARHCTRTSVGSGTLAFVANNKLVVTRRL